VFGQPEQVGGVSAAWLEAYYGEGLRDGIRARRQAAEAWMFLGGPVRFWWCAPRSHSPDSGQRALRVPHRRNRRRSLRVVTLRLAKHLTPFFGHRRLMTITTADVRAFTARRQAAGASNATINRDLMLLKRMGTLAMQAGKLTVRPYIPLLKERNIRMGFFEPGQFKSVTHHLPVHMQPIVEFAHVTSWRTPSEILPLEWRQVDMKAGEVRLDPGTTKNDDGRVFPFTAKLRGVLEDQHKVAERLKKAGVITPYVFLYTVGKVVDHLRRTTDSCTVHPPTRRPAAPRAWSESGRGTPREAVPPGPRDSMSPLVLEFSL
jgi:integrase